MIPKAICVFCNPCSFTPLLSLVISFFSRALDTNLTLFLFFSFGIQVRGKRLQQSKAQLGPIWDAVEQLTEPRYSKELAWRKAVFLFPRGYQMHNLTRVCHCQRLPLDHRTLIISFWVNREVFPSDWEIIVLPRRSSLKGEHQHQVALNEKTYPIPDVSLLRKRRLSLSLSIPPSQYTGCCQQHPLVACVCYWFRPPMHCYGVLSANLTILVVSVVYDDAIPTLKIVQKDLAESLEKLLDTSRRTAWLVKRPEAKLDG